MANQGAKKRREENEKHMLMLQRLIISVNAVYIVVRVSLFFSSFSLRHWAGLVLTTMVYKWAFDALMGMAQPAFDEHGNLIDGGHDLSLGGMCAYLHDIIYITAFVQVASILSDWFWLAYLVVPGFALWKLWTEVLYPYIFHGSEGEGEEDEKSKKKREKLERKAARAAKFANRR